MQYLERHGDDMERRLSQGIGRRRIERMDCLMWMTEHETRHLF